MKSFLLLILSLTAGCEATSELKGCEGGWVELTCDYLEAALEGWDKKGRFDPYHDARNKNLRIVIKQFEQEDFGKYNCEFDQEDGSEEHDHKLEVVKDGCQTPFNPAAHETDKTTITCDFPNKYNSYDKFICKEACEDTNSFNMFISNVKLQHAGVYWCGVRLKKGSDRASCKNIQLKIKIPPTPPTTTTPDNIRERIMIICIAVLLLLLLVIIVIFIYKRFSSSRNTRNEAAAQHVKEDNAYEELQERPQETGSGNAMKTIYATANLPTNPSASMNYSTVTFQNSTDKANSEVLIHKPSSSACEYSTVKNSQSPVYSTVNKPSKTSEDPVLLTVNKTQQQ